MIPKILNVKDKDEKDIDVLDQLALALCLLHVQPSSRVVVKGRALIPRSIQKVLGDKGLANIQSPIYKIYLNVRIPRGRQKVVLPTLQTFVDQECFQETRADWAEQYQNEVIRQKWRYMHYHMG